MQTEQEVDFETGVKIGAKRYYDLKWENDCEFNLILDVTKNKFDKIDSFINENGGIDLKMVKTVAKCVTIQTSIKGGKAFATTSCKID